ncbi:hypothetical protein N657DRAFT_682980 [Parathielavia appendiculata]|uniref:DUF3824 domain-containing protein n=1 Tax=Parathielavia appendiculata TaxID=2587402 RepID=A0AAN6TV64_9PEZI|nr:hypothetical protein N657DRAFT_682980 [Parathielavia appendiculata]
MPEVYRESRYVRERDASPSSDEGYKRTTVRRYKVTPDRVERVEREVDIVEEERRSRYAPIRRSSRDEIIDRLYIPERPRSAYDPSPHSATYVERQVIEREREREPRDEHYTRVDRVEYRGDGPRGAVVERERVIERDDRDLPYPTERTRTVVEREVVERDRDDDYHRSSDRDRGRVVYESTKEVERVDRNDVYSPRDWERRSYWDDEKETEVRVEKRVEHRDGGEVRVERRVEERRDDGYPSGTAEVERWRKETEYYEPAPPPPAPIVIRQRAPEQKIIVQEAPPATVVIREQAQEPREITVARRGSRDGEYYYHRESREIGPYRGELREEEVAVARYDDDHRHRHHHHHHHRRHHHHGGYSDAESDDGYYLKRTVTRRERSESSSPHRKRHLAEGALAGAGIGALLASKRDGQGEFKQHRGRKVLAGAALGALGTEVARRAHSAYQERFEDERERERSRSRSRPPHSRLKTGLGIAAVALAAAGAAKYYQSNKIEKEEATRGRALHRDSDSDRSPSRKRSKSRASSLAKAGLGTAAVAGLVQHYRHKSKTRNGKSRSRSRVRTGAEILAAGLAGAGAKKLYDRHKEKKEGEHERELDRQVSDDDYYDRDARDYNRRSRSRSLTRSGPTYPDGDPSVADPELGMVEYGAHPLPVYPEYGHDTGRGAAAGYDSAAEDRSRRRRRRHRSRGDDDYSADSEAETDRDKKTAKKRSGSRLRDLAAGAAAAGAAAIGIKKYNDKKDKGKEKERDEKERERDRARDRERERETEREKGRERDRRRYGDDVPADDYDNYGRRAPSPLHASGGYYNPPPAAPPGSTNGFTQHPNVPIDNLNQHYAPYPPDTAYTPYSPPMPGPPPNSATTTGAVPPPTDRPGPEHVSEASCVGRSTPEPGAAVRSVDKDGIIPSVAYAPPHPRPPPPAASESVPEDAPRTPKSVVFIPLSPKSSATLRRHHEEHASKSETEDIPSESDDDGDEDRDKGLSADKEPGSTSSRRRRRKSDPSSDRALAPPVLRSRDNRDTASSFSEPPETDDEEVIEMLPDRFDAQGRPLDDGSEPSSSYSSRGWHSRRGDFEYRSPRGSTDKGGLNMRGEWGVAGTDAEVVERVVQRVTGVLEGRGSWWGLIGGILSGSLLHSGSATADEGGGGGEGQGTRRISDRLVRDQKTSRDDNDEDWGRRRRRREEGSSRHADDRRRDDYDDDRYDEERKRRRRRRGKEQPYDMGVDRAHTWG